MEVDKKDFDLTGWIIEQSTTRTNFWSQHTNRKIYANETVAQNALDEIQKSTYWMSKELRDSLRYRIVPVYTVSPGLTRWFTINSIIES